MANRDRESNQPVEPSSEYVKGGKGRKDDVRGSRIYPASSPDAPVEADVRTVRDFVKHRSGESTSPRVQANDLMPSPVARAEMLIRRPAREVFEAFVDPAITTKFWFTKSSGRLEPGREVTWQWEMYALSVHVHVRALEPHTRLVIDWSASGKTTTVEWTFTSRTDTTTFVSVTNSGFSGDRDELVTQAIASSEGFALVLAGLKAFLEHGVMLNLVADRHPDGLA
jgi:uncharacterized protein YndB with AHSA1/START domain